MKPDTRWTACIFDFDGVLIDSEPLHAEAKRITLNHFQIPHADDLFTKFKGRPDYAFFRHVETDLSGGRASAREMEAFKVATYLDLFGEVPLVPGVLDFLATARKGFQKLGLATSATRHDFELGAQKYELTKWFDAIVTGDDTVKHKPDPEPYVKALAALGVSSSDALVIEDSPNGICAAKAAHCSVVGLTTNFRADELRDAGADVIATSYCELVQILGLASTAPTIYDAIGGLDGVVKLAAAWHHRVMKDEVVAHAFSHGYHPQHTERLAAYWAEALGGQAVYTGKYGNETSVVRMHSGNGLHEEMDQRAIACFDQALEDVGVVRDGRLWQALHDYFAWSTNNTMARYHHSADDVPEGLRIVKWSWEGLESGNAIGKS